LPETDPATRSYTENYDRIARDDLDAKVMDERYIENLAANFCERVAHVSGSDICDIGSGKGFLVRKLLARGAASVTAVDISSPYLVRLTGQPGVFPLLANAEALPFVEHFDIVVATDVLEHVLNVGSFLYSVNRALRPNGRFYVRVPHRENLLPYFPASRLLLSLRRRAVLVRWLCSGIGTIVLASHCTRAKAPPAVSGSLA
jgi:2-polyprenyl-3-methyl-5-hydroxy-6-metoxy-1,4-benzoquinol methylase